MERAVRVVVEVGAASVPGDGDGVAADFEGFVVQWLGDVA